MKTLSNHHLLPKSRGGIKWEANISRIDDSVHIAFHRIFWNRTPPEQLLWLRSFNAKILSIDTLSEIDKMLKEIGDDKWTYKKWILIPRN